MNRKTLTINLIFLISFALSIIFIKEFMDSGMNGRKKNNLATPDAYMLNAFYLRTNEEGQRDVVVYAPKVTHFKARDTSFFDDPRIYIYKRDEEWLVTSKKAKGVDGTAIFYLFQDVLVKQLPSRKSKGTVLATQSLRVFPKQNLVTTDDFVTITQPGLTISSKGLRGDLNTGNIQLLSKTRGQYDPKKAL